MYSIVLTVHDKLAEALKLSQGLLSSYIKYKIKPKSKQFTSKP
jgi:hypothetical protein